MPDAIAVLLCIIALLKYFWDLGEMICKDTLKPPADSPKTVIESESPPKYAIFSWTHSKAKLWSLNPAFPGTSLVPRDRKPKDASL